MAYFKSTFGLIERLTITATSAGTLALVNNSRTYQQLTGTTTHTVTLPTANAAAPNDCPNSLEFFIMNRSTGIVTVNYAGGSLAKSMAANTQAKFILIDNSTSDGAWDISNEAGASTAVSLTSAEKMGALAALGSSLYVDSGTSTTKIDINPEEIGGEYWTTKNNFLGVRANNINFTLNGYMYLTGGGDGSNAPLATTERYNDDANYSLARTSITTARKFAPGFSSGAKGYVTGGATNTGNSTFTATTEAYDDSLNSWSSVTALPSTIQRTAGGFHNGYAYVIGGTPAFSSSGAVATVSVYNPTANAWYTRGPRANAVYQFGVFVSSPYIFAVGGSNTSATPVNFTERFFDATNSWMTQSVVPASTSTPFVHGANGLGYALGGVNGSYLSGSYQFTPIANVWATKLSTPVAIGDGCGGALNGSGYLAAGSSTVPVATNYKYNAVSYFRVPIVKKLTTAPTTMLVAATLNGVTSSVPVRIRTDGENWKYMLANLDTGLKTGETISTKFQVTPGVYTFGGRTTALAAYFNDFSNTWTAKTSVPSQASNIFAFTLSGTTYLAGNNNGFAAAQNYAYSELTNSYTSKGAPLSTVTYNGGSFPLNGIGYTVGGYTSTSVNYVNSYNPDTVTWTAKGNYPINVYSPGCAAAIGFGFAFGGSTTNNYPGGQQASYRYNDVADTWTSIAATGTNGLAPCIFPINGYIYIGAFQNTSAQGTSGFYRYDPIANSNTSMTSLSSATSSSCSSATNGFGFAIGGYDSGNLRDYTQRYSPDSNTWASRTAALQQSDAMNSGNAGTGSIYNYDLQVGLPTYLASVGAFQVISRANSIGNHSNGSGGAYLDGKTFTFDNPGVNSGSEFYDHANNAWTSWTNYPDSSFPGGSGSFALGGLGFMCNGPNGVTYAANPTTNAWVSRAATINTRFRVLQSASYSLNGYGWWYGGDQNNSSTLLNTIDRYDNVANSWLQRAASNVNSPRYSGGFHINGFIYTFGGNDTSGYGSQLDRYSDGANIWTTRASYPVGGNSNVPSNTVCGFPYSFGGWNGSILSAAYRYSDALNAFTTMPNFVGGGRENTLSDNATGLLSNGDNGGSQDTLVWKIIPAIQNIVLGAGLRVS